MKYLLSFIFSIVMLSAFSANSFWQKIANRNLVVQGERKIIPQKTSLVQLDDIAFREFQANIPTEESRQSVLLVLPTPNGTEMTFRIFESACMDKQLADKYPMIKTYQAISVDNPAVTAKLDYTLFGFHAMVFSTEGIYFIDPYSSDNTGYYNCYYKKDYTRTSGTLSVCQNDETHISNDGTQQRVGQSTTSGSGIDNIISTGVRRTYRLALACTIEYSNAVCAPNPVTKPRVLSAMVTSMNRVNGVYEKDLSIHMNLVPNNDTLIFIGSDSYSNNDGGAMLGQNQTVCNARIGSANYDIGHVFSTGGGGVAYLGCVCVNADKARGVTGSGNPIGDGFDIDYVAHEMGHQFGANHTFNGNTGACNGNRNGSTAYEPGSGITIMGYAGICDANDIQPHSDDFFHRISIDEIYNHISSTSCAVITNTGNTPPIVPTYRATYSIPYKTSFEVTAAATSPNGNPLNYLWEEWDLGPAGSWSNPNIVTAPIFRSFVPNPSPTRVFPRWDSLINNVIRYKGEVLPETTRDVKLRCTVTSLDANGYGAFNAPDSNLTIKSVITPALFRVTSQSTATTFTGNTTQTITWNVAGTTAAPISCANVNIYLSLDSARTFPYLLASNTTNDGTETVTIPNVATANASARIKVKGSGNVFFDLNDGWIRIDQAVSAAFTASNTSICKGESVTFTNTSLGNPDSVRWTINGGTPNTSNSITTVVSAFNTAGTYTIRLVAYKSGVASTPFTTSLTVKPSPTIIFSPTTPVTCAGTPISITANYIPGATCVWSTGSSNTTISVSPTQNTYYFVTVTNDGCSTIDSVLVRVNPTPITNLVRTICSNESVTIGTSTFNTPGNYTVVLNTSSGCDSTVNLALTVNPTKITNLAQSICDGESVTIGSSTFNSNGNHSVTLQTSLGCDSTVNLSLTVNPNKLTNLTSTICDGESVTIGSTTFNTSGNYTVVLNTSLGCDSTVNLALTVNPIKETNLALSICDGESVTIGSSTFSTNGNHSVTLQTSLGCDSIVNLNLTVKPTPTIVFTPVMPVTCAGTSIDITAEYIAGATCIWSTGSSNTTITVAPTQSTYYSVSVTNDGCTAMDSVLVNVNPIPATPAITQSNDTLYSNVIISGASYLWYNSNVLVATTITPYYEFTSNGNFTLMINNNDCISELSAEISAALPTSIRTNKLDIQFSILPNPNNGLFEIRITSPKYAKYSMNLYNVTGQEILNDEMNLVQGVNSKLFNLNSLEKGIYFITLTNNEGISTQNIIVQ